MNNLKLCVPERIGDNFSIKENPLNFNVLMVLANRIVKSIRIPAYEFALLDLYCGYNGNSPGYLS